MANCKALFVTLRFDKNNELAMSNQELARLASSALRQGANGNSVDGVVKGGLSILSEDYATILDAKEGAVDGLNDLADDAADRINSVTYNVKEQVVDTVNDAVTSLAEKTREALLSELTIPNIWSTIRSSR